MRIGLLVTVLADYGQKGFYNMQEIGLAKALDSLFDEVKVYKLVSAKQKNRIEPINGCKNSAIQFIPSRGLGTNGKIDVNILDGSLDALVYFSDTQLDVPKVYKWAHKNNVHFFPYIGVIKSHSTSRVKRLIADIMFQRNLFVYKKSLCLAKTPMVLAELNQLGVKKITVTPVGLDISLLKNDHKNYSVNNLKKKYGYREEDKIVLFIGRLINEKQPERMIKIFSGLICKDRSYSLLMVGSGPLKEHIEKLVKISGIKEKIKIIDRIPNSDIWELYRIADVFVNLNQNEIFGMAILEAMYYGCRVVAWKAPGPNLIIEDGISGWIVESDTAVIEKITDNKKFEIEAPKRITSNFTWSSTAHIINRMLKKINE